MAAEHDGTRVAPEVLAETLRRHARLGLLLDFDGTLSEIVPRPADAEMRAGTRAALERLIAQRVQVAIVSGRRLDDVTARARLAGAWIVGCHGAELRDPSGARVKLVTDHVARRALVELFDRAVEATKPLGALVEDKGLAVAVHLRGLEERVKGELAATLSTLARAIVSAPIVTLRGFEVLEFRARGVDKGRAASTLLEVWEADGGVAIGDDVTDEDMFRVVAARGGASIKVGVGATTASFRLENPAAVETFLREVGALGRGRLELPV